MPPALAVSPVIDPVALERLLSLCEGTLRAALCAQLSEDFIRLDAAIAVPSAHQAGRAAHELKGLAATIGAFRLAEMATTLDQRGEAMDPITRGLLVSQLRHEIAGVLAQIAAAGAVGDAA